MTITFEDTMLPGKAITSTPMIAAVGLLCFFLLARIVYAQVLPVPPAGSDQTSVETLFRYGGWTLIIIALSGIAVAAIYNTFRKASITEWKETATVRKERIAELELTIVELRAEVRQLQRTNEDLEKKNLRLQDAPAQ